MNTIHIIAKTEKEKKTLSDIRTFSVKKYNSNRALSRCILEALNDYLNFISSENIAHTHKEGNCVNREQKRAKLYKELISKVTINSTFSYPKGYYIELIKLIFGMIDDRSANNYLQKLITDRYLREETLDGETSYYTIPEEAR